MKSFEAKNFDHLLGTAGFSDNLLKNHFTLYQGYVKNVNLLIEELETLLKDGKMGMPSYAELTRRFAWEFNGMRLHELYFGNMKKEGAALSQAGGLYEIIEKDIKPILALHLGSVTYEGFKDGVVSIRFEGTCKGCPFSTLTLKAGVEEILKSKIEGVTEVVAV